jgi:hypothetical protein
MRSNLKPFRKDRLSKRKKVSLKRVQGMAVPKPRLQLKLLVLHPFFLAAQASTYFLTPTFINL